MKVQQCLVLLERECHAAYYSWQSYVNEKLMIFSSQPGNEDVRLLTMTDSMAVITYLIEVSE